MFVKPGTVVPRDRKWGFTIVTDAGVVLTHPDTYVHAFDAKKAMRDKVREMNDLTEQVLIACGFTRAEIERLIG